MTITELPVDLPSPVLTPAERAWDAIDYMRAHPDEANLGTWGKVHPKDRTRTVGCFAHTVVKRAGYTFTAEGEGRGHAQTPQGPQPVYVVAAELLGVDWSSAASFDGLFSWRGTLAARAELVEARFGPRPVAA
jgi:hypothetical protein